MFQLLSDCQQLVTELGSVQKLFSYWISGTPKVGFLSAVDNFSASSAVHLHSFEPVSKRTVDVNILC